MNHLEPLSWHAIPPRAPTTAHAREVLAHQHPSALLSLSIRSTFRVIAKILEDCRKSTPPTCLAVSVDAVAELARVTFEVAAGRPCCGAPFRYDRDRYLDGLQRLGKSLSVGTAPTPSELAHALDSLIVLLVQLDQADEEETSPMTVRADDAGVRHEVMSTFESPGPGGARPPARSIGTIRTRAHQTPQLPMRSRLLTQT